MTNANRAIDYVFTRLRQISIGTAMKMESDTTHDPGEDKSAKKVISILHLTDTDSRRGLPARLSLNILDRVAVGYAPLEEENVSPSSLAFLNAAAGVARCVLHRSDRVAAAFFNAGTELRRGFVDKNKGKKYDAGFRVILNGLGLLWALQENEDLNSALTDGDGFDCAINLFGALTSVDHLKEEVMNLSGGHLAAQLLVCAFDIGIDQNDLRMINGSLKELHFSITSFNEIIPDKDDMIQQVSYLVQIMVSDILKLQLEHPISLLDTAKIVSSAFKKLAEQEGKSLDDLARNIRTLIASFEEVTPDGELQSLVVNIYRPFLEKGPFEPAFGLAGFPGEQEWEDLYLGRIKECTSIGEAFRSSFLGSSAPSDDGGQGSRLSAEGNPSPVTPVCPFIDAIKAELGGTPLPCGRCRDGSSSMVPSALKRRRASRVTPGNMHRLRNTEGRS